MTTTSTFRHLTETIRDLLNTNVFLGKAPSGWCNNAIVFFPARFNTLNCGLAGIVSYNRADASDSIDLAELITMLDTAEKNMSAHCLDNHLAFNEHYLGGSDHIHKFSDTVRNLNNDEQFSTLFFDNALFNELSRLGKAIETLVAKETAFLESRSGTLPPRDVDIISERIEKLMDIRWCIESEVSSNIIKVKDLVNVTSDTPSTASVYLFKKINSVLNSIDRLEVRGRDSAGISLMFTLSKEDFETFRQKLIDTTIYDQLKHRTQKDVLLSDGITIHDSSGSSNGDWNVSISFVYKIAAEIGSLGDNVNFLRHRIISDQILQTLATCSFNNHTVSAHTRWASVGEISEANCHPVDNEAADCGTEKSGIIHVCLNGDIDNHLELKEKYEDRWGKLQPEITTDTKIIPMQIERYLKKGHDITEAFRLAVNDFEGSHAISMHTDLAPGKLFLAQRGSGQAIFIGIANNHFMSVSEVYGFVEETPWYLKLDGEKIVEGINGKTQGQLFILDQERKHGNESKVAGIQAMYYDSTPIVLTDEDVKHTEITSRDIDRQDFRHYFLKEISESPVSVEKTIRNRWKIDTTEDQEAYVTALDESVVPKSLIRAFETNTIKRIYFVGQGTAGVAALACSGVLTHYLNDTSIHVSALKASEFSGFMMSDDDDDKSLSDTLVIAISQSGTTTDTNLAVDMVRERGAHTLAIVNRRDSDLTFKVDGVIYTSSGRDIEMSVASTKAFYSQIVAGSVLGLHIVSITGKRDKAFVSNEIKQLLDLPKVMRKVLDLNDKIEASARRYAITKTYWAAVGSGSNKASADEIRIKLSELCYKTISSDFVEDKKHIDLSSEPLIIVCAAGTRESVLGDIIKDTAIFHAHKALPIVIANEGEERFNSYAKSVFHVPALPEHLAPIVNTLAGHIWGYYAALSINEGSKFVYNHRQEIQTTINDFAEKGLNVYEVFLENTFREKITEFYNDFRKLRREKRIPAIIGFNTASDLTLIMKYLAGKLPVSDFEMDFTVKGTPLNMLDLLFEYMNESIDAMARPIDAIKHQAKTVTVGTSRISEKVEGLLFEILSGNDIKLSQLTSSNILVLRNLQGVIGGTNGLILYKINNLSLLGKATQKTTINVVNKDGVFESVPSRVETDNKLKGTKSIIVREGNVFIGRGLKDNKNILSIPILSQSGNTIEYIISLNVLFKEGKIPLIAKVKALGGKHERIRNIIQENGLTWDDAYLEYLKVEDLFGLSAEKIGEQISRSLNGE